MSNIISIIKESESIDDLLEYTFEIQKLTNIALAKSIPTEKVALTLAAYVGNLIKLSPDSQILSDLIIGKIRNSSKTSPKR